MKHLNTIILAILGGMCIGLGATAYLASENKIFGGFLFTTGLFLICTRGYNLFTGKVGYLFDNKPAYLIDLVEIWAGNFIGSALVGGLLLLTRFGEKYSETAASIVEAKLSGNLLSVFILGIFCNIMMYVGVDGFKNIPQDIGKYLGLFFAVLVFIFAGFEHCIANMYYITIAQAWSADTVVLLLVSTAGNIVGGILFPIIQKAAKACKGEVK